MLQRPKERYSGTEENGDTRDNEPLYQTSIKKRLNRPSAINVKMLCSSNREFGDDISGRT